MRVASIELSRISFADHTERTQLAAAVARPGLNPVMIACMRLLVAVVVFCLAALPFAAGRQGRPCQLSRSGLGRAERRTHLRKRPPRSTQRCKLAPQQPTLLLGAGVAARLQGRDDDARRLLLDALKIEPALTAASLCSAAVLYQTGDIDGAIDTYQRALVARSRSSAAGRSSSTRGAKKRIFTAASAASSAITSPSCSKARPKRTSPIARSRFSRRVSGGSARRSSRIRPT